MSNRTKFKKTPGKFVWSPDSSPVAIYSSKGWSFEMTETLVDLTTTRDGAIDQVVTGRLVKIEGEPTQFNIAGLAKLFTHGNLRMGASIIGGTDQVAELHTVDGVKRKLLSAFVYQEPAMSCMAGKTILGNTVIYGIIPIAGDSGDLDDLYTVEAVTWSDADYNTDEHLTPGWIGSWSDESASDWDDIETKDPGFTITPKSQLTEDISTRDGLVDVTIQGYGVDVSCKAMNISEALVRSALQPNLKMGQRKGGGGRTLKLRATTEDAFIYVFGAVLQPTKLMFNATDHVVSDLAWRSFPTITSGVQGGHLLVTTGDPDAV